MDSTNARDEWAERTGEYSPAYYAYYGPDETSELLRETLGRHLDRDATVLEVGCSSGRHLAHLAEGGFEDLWGVDVNAEAFDVMADQYPTLAETGTFRCAPIEEVVEDWDDGQFDAVYTVQTLQHLPPDDETAFAELARVTGDVLVTVEVEGDATAADADDAGDSDDAGTDEAGDDAPAVNYVDDGLPLYYRNWSEVFTLLGFTEIDVIREGKNTVRAFRAE